MFELKPDFDQTMDRFEAWWKCQVLDRPLVTFTYPKPESERIVPPDKRHASLRERWLDTEYQVAHADVSVRNQVYCGEALPIVWPNLGPEIFSAFYGCPLNFSETTVWSEPILEDWSPGSLAKLRLDHEGFFFKKLIEMTDRYTETARGKYIVGYTDFHAGGDAIAAFRDPQRFCTDLLEYEDEIKALLDCVTDDFIQVYDFFHQRLAAAGMPSTTWLPATCRGRYHVPSNDFSCMISNRMFEEIFLPGIIRECRHTNRCIYHLDGRNALRYLDTLLAIPEIHAIQWVAGAGYDYWADWIEVYRRIQRAGKAFIMYPPVKDLERVFKVLRPEGAWLCLPSVKDREEADQVLTAVAKWR
ncbi:MAG: hypothetical protein NTX50_21515 [Candidatus Sumerlaeota bacterium]|nr:hypothetical protein [Candidatus Sumerlaeota bacterium]